MRVSTTASAYFAMTFPWQCIMSDYFINFTLRRHQALHSSKTSQNVCNGCGKTFSRLDALNVRLVFLLPFPPISPSRVGVTLFFSLVICNLSFRIRGLRVLTHSFSFLYAPCSCLLGIVLASHSLLISICRAGHAHQTIVLTARVSSLTDDDD